MKPESGCSGPHGLLTDERRCGDEEARSGQRELGSDDPARRNSVPTQARNESRSRAYITLVLGLGVRVRDDKHVM